MKTTKMITLCIAIMAMFAGCSKNEELNLATGISPRVKPTVQLEETIGLIRAAGSDAERLKIIENNNWLTNRLVSYARKMEQIPNDATIDSLVWYYGSAQAQAEDRNKKIFNGKIVNEPVAFIYFSGRKQPVVIILYCQNGMFGTLKDFESLSRLGVGALEFTIDYGQGINRYVDYQTSIDLAERFRLDLYKGKGMTDKNLITPDEARGLESEIESIQVTVKVYPGDHFNLREMTYTNIYP